MRHFFLAVVIVVMAALGARAFTVDGVTYSTSDGVATVTGASSKSITRLTIPASVTYGGTTYSVNFIAGNAFWGYSSLRELIIEDSDVYIGSTLLVNSDGHNQFGDPFNGCPIEKAYVGRNLANKLSSSHYQADITHITSTEPFDLTIAGKSTFILAGMTNGLTFRNSQVVTTLTVGGAVESIESNAFNGCTNLRKVTILPGETPIKFAENNIFTGCPIDSLIVGRDIPSSNNQCGGAKVKTLIITPEVGLLYGRIYGYDDAISKVVIEDGPNDLVMSMGPLDGCNIDSIYFGRNCIAEHRQILNGAKVRNVIFGPKITEIPAHCRSHSEVETVSILGDATVVHPEAFRDCRSLREVVFPSSLKEIGTSAFSGCSSLSKADIPEGVEAIRSSAFSDTKITELTVPASMNLLESAFHNSPLKKVWISDGDTDLTMRNGPFDGCELDSIYFGRNCIAERQQILYGSKVKNVIFGPKIIEIPAHCEYHSEIETVSFSSNVTKIHPNAFANCKSLDSIFSKAKFPPVFAKLSNNFPSEIYETATLTVPVGSKKAYRSAEVWKLFRNIQSEGGGFKVSVSADTAYGEVLLNGSSVSEITVDEDESLTVAISPVEGYSISNVTVNGTDVTASLVDGTLEYESLDSNMEIEVMFSIITFTLSVPAELTGGHILVNGLDAVPATVDYGSRLEISAVPDRGYLLASMTVGGVDVTALLDENRSYVIDRVTADVVVDAVFEPIVYTVTAVAPTEFGTLTLNGATGDCRVAFGQPLVIGVTPANEGCYLASLTVDGTNVTASVKDGVYTVESVEADMTVEAVFGINTYTVEFVCDPERGAIIPDLPGSDAGVTVTHGATLNLAITPAEGFEIESVLLDGTDVTSYLRGNSVLTLEYVKGPHRVEAVFAVRRVRLSVLGLEGGQLSMRYDYGSPVTMLVEPADGWMFHSLTVGDEVVTVLDDDDSYTIPSLTDDTTVSVVFRLDQGAAGVDELTRRITVSARQRTVTITGASEGEAVEIYDTSGMRVYRGTDHVIDLSRQGVFIVRVASLSFKVMLK